jgi:hypothetical protein
VFAFPQRLAVLLACLLASLALAAPASAGRTEDPSLRTATSNTYRLDDGRYLTRFFTHPVNFHAGSAGWRRIDTDLVPSARPGYALRAEATPYELDLPRDAGAAPVRFASDDAWVSFALVDGRGEPAAADGAAARYRRALPGVDLRYDALTDGVKETLVLRDPSVPERFRFVVRTSFGVEPRLADGGRVDFVRSDGSSVFHFEAPFMEDAGGASSRAIGVALDRRLDGWSMTLAPSAAWLRARDRSWPVRLDPTVRVGPITECAYIRKTSNAAATQCDNPDFVVDNTGGAVKRPLIRFDVRSLPFASVVTSAQMKLYGSGANGTVTAHQLLKPWTMAASWHYYDSSNRWAAEGGDYVSQPAATRSVTGGWNSWDLTALTQLWVDDLQANDGVILITSDSETFSFATARRGAATGPHLEVIYATEALAPTMEEPEHNPPLPEGWVDNVALNVTGRATDVGVGLQQMTLRTPLSVDTDVHKYFCDITQPSTCEATDSTKCGGTWVSRCPLIGSKPFSYTTRDFREGIVTAGVRARDAANNESPQKSWTLKVDHSPPTLDTPTGELYVRRNRTDDHRQEGLYGPAYSVSVVAHDGDANTRRSGVKYVAWRLYNAAGQQIRAEDDHQPASRPCSARDGCHHELQGSFDLSTDSLADGDYRLKIIGVDQLNHQSAWTQFWFTVDRRGDVYTARDYDAAPSAGGTAQGFERAQLPSRHARREAGGLTSTRRVIACSWDASRTCAENRTLHLEDDDPDSVDRQHLSTIIGTSADDARLSHVATVFAPMPGAALVGSGDIVSAMQPWQTAPPAHGPTYELHEVTETVQEGDQVVQAQRRRWIDGATRLPLREVISSNSAPELEILFTYDRSRLELAQLPAETFAVEPSAADATRSTEDYHSNPPPEYPAGPEDDPVTYDEASTFRAERGMNTDEAFVRSTLTDVALQPSIARYGIPLTAAELAELDVRADAGAAIDQIEQWATDNAVSEYAGAYVDQAAGGLVRVGFTANAATRLSEIQAFYPYPGRLRTFAAARNQDALKTLYRQISGDMDDLPSLGVDVSGAYVDVPGNVIKVQVPAPTDQQRQTLASRYGAGAQLEQSSKLVKYQHEVEDSDGAPRRVNRQIPPAVAGLRITSKVYRVCSTGFSMRLGAKWRVTTAGHCVQRGDSVVTATGKIGEVATSNAAGVYRGFGADDPWHFDGAFIAAEPRMTSRHIYVNPGQPDALLPVTGQFTYRSVPIGQNVCVAGAMRTRVRCGEVRSKDYSVWEPLADGDHLRHMIMMRQPTKGYKVQPGDSGGAVYDPSNRVALGLVNGGNEPERTMIYVSPIYTITLAWRATVLHK